MVFPSSKQPGLNNRGDKTACLLLNVFARRPPSCPVQSQQHKQKTHQHMNWYLTALKKYAVFGSRSRRAEYWFFLLFNVLISVVLGILDGVLGTSSGDGTVGLFGGVYSLAVLIPGIAVTIRRLHDTDRSGWWALICFVPCVGAIILIVFLAQEGTPGPNRFGENPKLLSA